MITISDIRFVSVHQGTFNQWSRRCNKLRKHLVYVSYFYLLYVITCGLKVATQFAYRRTKWRSDGSDQTNHNFGIFDTRN
ncbi:hypothetical protein MPLB_1530008 [Mesorhizobium sp. ORS 3324]|nr:hypothetical protein MPLB_1530008 [Mesorhizobium sp. ORS 3324]